MSTGKLLASAASKSRHDFPASSLAEHYDHTRAERGARVIAAWQGTLLLEGSRSRSRSISVDPSLEFYLVVLEQRSKYGNPVAVLSF